MLWWAPTIKWFHCYLTNCNFATVMNCNVIGFAGNLVCDPQRDHIPQVENCWSNVTEQKLSWKHDFCGGQGKKSILKANSMSDGGISNHLVSWLFNVCVNMQLEFCELLRLSSLYSELELLDAEDTGSRHTPYTLAFWVQNWRTVSHDLRVTATVIEISILHSLPQSLKLKVPILYR